MGLYNVQLGGGVFEVNFGYHVKMEGYARLRSDIIKLWEITPLIKNLKFRMKSVYFYISHPDALEEMRKITGDLE